MKVALLTGLVGLGILLVVWISRRAPSELAAIAPLPAAVTTDRVGTGGLAVLDPQQSAENRARTLAGWSADRVRQHVPTVVGWAESGPVPLRASAIWALGLAGGSVALETLERIMADTDTEASLRADAITARARADTHSVEFAERWVSDPQPAVALAARRVLRREDRPPDEKIPTTLVEWQEAVATGGDPAAGRRVFLSPQVGCAQCHVAEGRGRVAGPGMDGLGRDRATLIEAIVEPAKVVHPDFQSAVVETRSGELWQGIQARTAADGTVTLIGLDGQPWSWPASEVAKLEILPGSIMPEGLAEAMTRAEFRDLLAYLESLR